MFYSQFILAKKGPLGTIWIAAHLERKLRKNQVADTDIGVSVDSILCPDVPIALRLSSHLLLGVVRIYSRKVNYLFHDCSEALLKVKQAFRSTAVDLPPEESTAPYHSITLPETFHLDDFDLPDSAFQGDFVDHHVSTKEQITLQDTIDGSAFSTMQFGLEERFGDDNASHIGLDLDEELFLSKHSSLQNDSITLGIDERAQNHGQSSSSLHVIEMDIDGDQNGFVKNSDAEVPEDLSNANDDYNDNISAMDETKKCHLSSNLHAYNIQTPDLNEAFFPSDHIEGIVTSPSGIASIADDTPSNLVESAHVPPTPGLLEEAFPANIHENPALSPQQKLSPSSAEEALKPDKCSLLLERPDSVTINNPSHVVALDPGLDNGVQFLVSQETEQPAIPDETQMECRQKNVANEDDKLICTEMSVIPLDHQDHVGGEVLHPENTQMGGTKHDVLNTLDESLDDAEATLKTLGYNNTSGAQVHTSNAVSSPDTSNFHLRPCTSKGDLHDELSAEGGTLFQNASEVSTKGHGVQSEVLISKNTLDGGQNLIEVQGKDSSMENAMDARTHEAGYKLTTDVPLTSEFLEPEKMLLAPSGNDLINELSQLTVEKGGTESDGSNRISSLSGKKRRALETSSALENDCSVKLAGRPRVRRSTEHIPDDDDLLSSILVTKRTPLLWAGPTPPTKSVSLKHPRMKSSLGMSKRKVLVDDTTVLHADTIRQQLINTEDIRRIRKKAPCTRPEIWLIQKNYLEDEVFDEPTFTGISDELNALHNQNDYAKFVVEVNENEKPLLASIIPTTVDGETQGAWKTPISLEELEDKGRGEFNNHELLQSEYSLCPLDNQHDTIDGSNRSMLSAPSEECGHVMVNGVSHDTAPGDSSDIHQERVNVLDQTNDELSEIKDSSTLHFAENPCYEEFPATSSKPEGTDASPNFYGPPMVFPLAPSVDNDATISTINSSLDEGEAFMLTDMSSVFPSSNSPMRDVTGSGEAADLVVASGHKVIDGEVSLDAEVLMEHAEKKFYDGENHIPGLVNLGRPEVIENGQIPSAIGETSGLQEFTVDDDVVVESVAMNLAMGRETSDFCSAIDGNDTEFLNVDDEAEHEESVNDMPSNDDVQSLENSGWSFRTRGVARYLKVLFDEEAGHARKTVAVDHLIAGKSRKEASRMFFETLVLKTKDFIHVEQEDPYGFINIKPRGKLLKSEF